MSHTSRRKVREKVTKRVYDLLAPLNVNISRDRLGARYGYNIHASLFVSGDDLDKVEETLRAGGLLLRVEEGGRSPATEEVRLDIATYCNAVVGVRLVGNRLEADSDWTLSRIKELIGVKRNVLSDASKKRALMAGAQETSEPTPT